MLLDVDGTLFPSASLELAFFRWLRRTGAARMPGPMETAVQFVLHAEWSAPSRWARGKGYFAGTDAKRSFALAEEFAAGPAHRYVSGNGWAAIDRALAAGEEVRLLSGSPHFLVEPLAASLGLAGGWGCPLEVEGGRFTGRIAGLDPYGAGKLAVLNRFLLESGPARTRAYANSVLDRHLLRAADEPVAVNPDPLLRAIARRRGWRIERWA